jgi:hypothetical protein
MIPTVTGFYGTVIVAAPLSISLVTTYGGLVFVASSTSDLTVGSFDEGDYQLNGYVDFAMPFKTLSILRFCATQADHIDH